MRRIIGVAVVGSALIKAYALAASFSIRRSIPPPNSLRGGFIRVLLCLEPVALGDPDDLRISLTVAEDFDLFVKARTAWLAWPWWMPRSL